MEDFIPVVAILAVFGTITAIIFGPKFLKTRERRDMQETLRAAINKDQGLPPEAIEAMSKAIADRPTRTRDIRRGVVWLAVGVGLALFGLINDSAWSGDGDFGGHVGTGMLGIAAIPFTIGLAFIVLSFFNPNKE
ncbi:DUF6249 domain-containing protein [Brevundimonas sp.]|uniref:DUF6249 domain-containing protein n=1 Tax=Brevundimonas sp. TaxID=1871086 RepID=UPI002D725CD5|nr:DUF6249 domain-containing protein [Brevundimonas sp.]HYD27082.1 DUF6249 domain-containing protein [Brevundimonas sp.]